MSSHKHVLAAVLGVFALASQAQVHGPAARPSTPAPVVSISVAPATSTPEMQRLMDSQEELRQAIRSLAQKPPGTERDVAIAKAQEALSRTRQAMRDLPPEYRATAAASSANRGYDDSVRSLMDAADALRHAVQAMAREPAGARRNQAIRDANRALLDTQVAMANAYDATAFPQRTASVGATPRQCVWLGTMWGC
jgi:hypothetical protein